jgi:GH35 family endo-1,4-beta-xylanase
MKRILLPFMAPLLPALVLAATPVPEGGTLVIPANAIAGLRAASTSRYATQTRVPVAGQPFTEALRCATTTRPTHSWDIQFQFRTTRKVAKGEVLWARFYARTLSTKSESGAGRATAIFEQAGPSNNKSLSRGLDFGREWQELCLPFKALDTYEAGQASAGFHFGTQEQVVEIADFAVYSYGTAYDLKRLPHTKVTYAGQAAAAPWRAAAAARIEKLRKGDLAITVTDASGRPVPGAKVTIAMQSHAFGWGSAVTVKNLLRQDADGEKYRAVIEKYFTRVVFENDLKWGSWDRPANHAKIFQAADWLRARHIEIRGHNLIWPSWRNAPKDLQKLKDQPEALRQRINSHIENEVSAMKGRVVDWDVINEPYDNHDVMGVLGDNEMIAWFKLARRCDPTVRLYLNDYAILSGGGLDTRHQDHFEKTLRFLKDGGAPITGLGMQSHFGGTPTPPERMLAILNRYAALGLDISITEHDIDTTDEQFQAEFTRDFLTTVFSHPSVVAVLTWGFWEKSHWRPNAAYYRSDWSLTPAGQAWLDLVTKKWWTNAALETGADGCVRTRGFLGDYEITVTHQGVSKTIKTALPGAGQQVEIRL